MIRLGSSVRALALKAGGLGSNPGPSEKLSLKITIQDLPDGYSGNQHFKDEIIMILHNLI